MATRTLRSKADGWRKSPGGDARPARRLRAVVPLVAVVVAFGLGVPSATASRSDALSLRDVVDRVGQYVVRYGESLATVVADESYTQRLVSRSGDVTLERALTSEIAFVKLAGSTEWQGFRDVLTVDGHAVAGGGGRLERVLQQAPDAVLSQVRLLAAESARYNLGSLHRDFNVPTTVLQFVHPEHQHRFNFRKRSEEPAASAEGLEKRLWVIEFRERGPGTLIRSTAGKDVPVQGRLWVVPDDGRIVRSVFTTEAFKTEIGVTWRHDSRLDLWVPLEMRERYQDRDGVEIMGVARYANYRRFDVTVRIVR
jgi:hypothetical protein